MFKKKKQKLSQLKVKLLLSAMRLDYDDTGGVVAELSDGDNKVQHYRLTLWRCGDGLLPDTMTLWKDDDCIEDIPIDEKKMYKLLNKNGLCFANIRTLRTKVYRHVEYRCLGDSVNCSRECRFRIS